MVSIYWFDQWFHPFFWGGLIDLVWFILFVGLNLFCISNFHSDWTFLCVRIIILFFDWFSANLSVTKTRSKVGHLNEIVVDWKMDTAKRVLLIWLRLKIIYSHFGRWKQGLPFVHEWILNFTTAKKKYKTLDFLTKCVIFRIDYWFVRYWLYWSYLVKSCTELPICVKRSYHRIFISHVLCHNLIMRPRHLILCHFSPSNNLVSLLSLGI